MTDDKAAPVRRFILDLFADPLAALGHTPETVPDDFDLLSEGVIDSFGMLELLTNLQERYALEGDFEDLDVEQATMIGPLSQYLQARIEEQNNPAAPKPSS